MKTWLPILLFCAVAASAAELPSFTAGKSTVSFTARSTISGVASASVRCARTRLPTGTGAGKRTLLSP